MFGLAINVKRMTLKNDFPFKIAHSMVETILKNPI